jgi:type 1 glutamine amidotransferase
MPPALMRALLAMALLAAGAALRAADAAPPTVLFLIGEPEYQTATTLPAFADHELAPRGLRCVIAGEDPVDHDDFTGLDALPGADLLVISVRRHAPTREHLALVRAHLAAGKPLVGIRTASHAFGAEPKDARHEGWPGFDAEVLGGSYHGHYGDVPAELALAPGAGTHAILAGVDPAAFAATRLYRNPTLAPGAVPLLFGRSQGATEQQHVAWTNQAGRSRVFYTSLGMPGDFATPAFRRMLRNAVFWALDRAPPPEPPSP